MKMSTEINELATAMSQMQGEMEKVSMSKQGYGYKYADISVVLDLAKPLLSKHGLSIAQFPSAIENGVSLETLLMHKSGQWLSSSLWMPVIENKKMNSAQALGAVISYARRYSLVAVLGIGQEDNDAQGDREDIKTDNRSTTSRPTPQQQPTQTNTINRESQLSINQVNELRVLLTETGVEEQEYIDYLVGSSYAPKDAKSLFACSVLHFKEMKELLLRKKDQLIRENNANRLASEASQAIGQ